MIVLKANLELRKVFYSLTKNIWKDVEWRDIFIIQDNCLNLLGKRRSLVFDFEEKKVESNILEFNFKPEDVIAIGDNEILTNVLDMTLYAYGKWGLIRGLRVDKDYASLNDMFNEVTQSIKIESSITKDSFRFFEKGKQLTLEDVVEKLVVRNKKDQQQQEEIAAEETAKDSDKYSMGLWHNMCWKMKRTEFKKSGEIDINSESDETTGIGNNFYETNYICPNCGKKLFMAVFPPRHEVKIETNDNVEKNVYIARTFSCKGCFSFFTPRPQKLLVEGDVYELSIENDRDAYEDYVELIGKDATNASNSEFNEYESLYRLKRSSKEYEEDTPDLNQICDNFDDLTDEEIAKVKNMMEDGFYPKSDLKKFYEKIAREFKSRSKISLKNFFAKKRRNKARKKQEELAVQEEIREVPESLEEINDLTTDTVDFMTAMAIANEENARQKKGTVNTKKPKKDKPIEYPIPKFDLPTINFNILSIDDLREIYDSLVAGNIYPPDIKERFFNEVKRHLTARVDNQYEGSCDYLDMMSRSEVEKVKLRILSEPHLSKSLRDTLLGKLNSILSKDTEPQWQQRAEECKNKNYAHIVKLIDEVEWDAPPTVKDTILKMLNKLRLEAAKRETGAIVKKLSGDVTDDEIEICRKKLREYTEIDGDALIDKIQAQKAANENSKISAFIQKYGVRNRNSLRNLLNDIAKQGFKEEYLSPYIEKLSKQLYDADKKEIERICPDPAEVTFEEGMRMYNEISRGVFLPELKQNTLELLDKRLYRLKMDECQQLAAKLKKDMGDKIKDYSLIYFYDERKMRKNLEDEESEIIRNAIYGYASDRDKYEFPVLIVNLNKKAEGNKGFVITPDNIYIKNNVEATLLEIPKIEEVYAKSGLFGKGIYAKYENNNNIKLCNTLKMKEYSEFANVLNDFVKYLQEKPQSRSIRYMVKEKHSVKCCYRCGFTYQGGSVCPKCGSKQNS